MTSVKIYTKTGDDGSTQWGWGSHASYLSKDDVRIEAYGALDELCSLLGMARSALHETAPVAIQQALEPELVWLQHCVFTIAGQLAVYVPAQAEETVLPLPTMPRLGMAETARLEASIDAWQAQLPELKHFILPGGGPMALSALHVARTMARRAERACTTLSRQDGMSIDSLILPFLNRTSDYLFVMARWLAFEWGVEETQWLGRQLGQ